MLIFILVGEAGGSIFYSYGDYFYEAVFLTGEYLLKDVYNYGWKFGGYNDWYFPNSTEVKHIAANLIDKGKHEEIEGCYWMREYGEYVYFSSSTYDTYYIRESKYGDTACVCLVHKFTDN